NNKKGRRISDNTKSSESLSLSLCLAEGRESLAMVVEMALKSSVSARLSIPSSSSSSTTTTSSHSSLCKNRVKHISVSLPTSTSISLLSLFSSPPNEAKAVSIAKDQIVSSLTEVEKTIDQVQEAGSSFLDLTQRVLQVVGEALKPAIETALPIAKQAGEEALKLASPAISEASKKAQEVIQSSGIDAQPVLTAAKTVTDVAQQTTKVIEDAKPIASTTIETISSADPNSIVVAVGAAFLAYLLVPPVWSVLSFNLRGYKGDLTPAQTLDFLCTKNYFLVDIRSEKDKDKAGIPRLPSSAKNRMIAIPTEELPNKVRGIVRNSKRVEAEIAALKISYLKRVNKGSNLIIMDSYSDSAKVVARTLKNLGFNNCWIVMDGFSGSKGWLQSRLGTDSYNFSFAQVLSPSRIIRSGSTAFGTKTGTRFLPGSD
ncbi:PREDICTED: calcium sensing receptor, chloroplastic, partial [Tarenaya hassleriana]|uniref:calcium sensing receptor, chloroplastic n=1 Tax=Tarenaya hassleriana TaxID=28532 RepID=UPI0008FD5A0D